MRLSFFAMMCCLILAFKPNSLSLAGGSDTLMKQKGVTYATVLTTSGHTFSDAPGAAAWTVEATAASKHQAAQKELINKSTVDYPHLASKTVHQESKCGSGYHRTGERIASGSRAYRATGGTISACASLCTADATCIAFECVG